VRFPRQIFCFFHRPRSSTGFADPQGMKDFGESEDPGLTPIPQKDAERMGHGVLFLFSLRFAEMAS
jgi:hypothetical protein